MTYYTVVAVKNERIFYLTDERLATDIPDRAASFYNRADAQQAANEENAQAHIWQGFYWQPNLEDVPNWNEHLRR